jgi:uncharacterized protein (DUF1499 family)
VLKRLTVALSFIAISACSALPAERTQFPPCPAAPHCVSSLAVESEQAIPAINVQTRAEWQRLQDTLLTMPRTMLVAQDNHYLHVSVSSEILRFKDDVELRYYPDKNLVEMRSSSRVGYYDFGVNRRRLETLRDNFNKANISQYSN